MDEFVKKNTDVVIGASCYSPVTSGLAFSNTSDEQILQVVTLKERVKLTSYTEL